VIVPGTAPVPAAELVVRPWRVEDAPQLQAAVVDSVEHLRPWMPWIAHEPLTVAQRAQLIAGWLHPHTPDEVFGLFAAGTVVGGCGLHPRIGPGGLEIGYWVRLGWTGRGYATEAARRLTAIALARPGITHVEIHHDVANVASGRVPAKLRFTLVGDHPETPTSPGESGVERIWRLGRTPAGTAS
jgi:ribosomal-protein-serine acetyltransferase